jgi:hypothetical protein
MTDDLMAQFAKMQEYTTALHAMVNAAQSQAPSESKGSDRTGSVHVTLDTDGIPVSFRVDNRWNRNIEADSFGDVVFEAFQAAIGDRLTVWSDSLTEDGWQERVDKLQGGPTGVAPEGRVPPAFRKPAEEVTPRALDEVAEDALKAFDNVDSYSMQPEGAIGTDRSGHLAIGLSSSGMTSCTADGQWVSTQSAARLMNALGEALANAKEDLAAKVESQGGIGGGLDRLLGEAMALLKDPSKYVD